MVEDLFLELAPHAAVLDRVFELAGNPGAAIHRDTREVARLLGLGSARLPEVVAAMQAAERAGAVDRDANGLWRVRLSSAIAHKLGLLLRGARLYRERIHSDRDTVRVAISKPAEPSQLVSALGRTLEGTWGLVNTGELLAEMAGRAQRRFTIMTPFVDEDGANRIVELFGVTRAGVRRELVVREGLPVHLKDRESDLCRLAVQVFDFRLPRPAKSETETFHAKVARVDDHECYLGSSNMTRWSFSYSLELGFHVAGAAGNQVSRVIDAVLEVSSRTKLSSGPGSA